jgi:hypothetical protein
MLGSEFHRFDWSIREHSKEQNVGLISSLWRKVQRSFLVRVCWAWVQAAAASCEADAGPGRHHRTTTWWIFRWSLRPCIQQHCDTDVYQGTSLYFHQCWLCKLWFGLARCTHYIFCSQRTCGSNQTGNSSKHDNMCCANCIYDSQAMLVWPSSKQEP